MVVSAAQVLPILHGDTEKLKQAERSQLIRYIEHYGSMSDEWIRRQIIEFNRIDILATVVLGYDVEPFHLAMMKYQFVHPDSLILVFRGAGKTTLCTISKAIHYLLKNPNIRILISSKTAPNGEAFLKEIKGHFEHNEKLTRIFGMYYHPRLVSKWDNREIEVLPRTINTKEASVTVVGVEGTVVSKHYDVILADDLVDEDNTRTQYMREKTKTWYYKTLDPTLEPPDVNVLHRGEYHRLGTRYHFDDLYGHLIKNELKDHHMIIPALNAEGRSPWPTKYPPEWFAEKRRKYGLIIFNSQYQCDTEAMKGEIFQYDDCQIISPIDIPDTLDYFLGVDLAISQDEDDDMFSIVAIGRDKINGMYDNVYVLDWFEGHLRFSQQTKKIVEFYKKWDPVRAAIETNAYQKAQYHRLKDDEDRDMRLKPVNQVKDKMVRAWKLSSIFEDGKVFIRKCGWTNLFIERLVLFSKTYKRKDTFDATDLAVHASKLKNRRKRKKKLGLI